MTYVIDRRLNSRNKSAVNRQRFLKRYKSHIQKAVQEAVKERSITDMERGENISIPSKDVSEPVFQHGPGGRRQIVHPGNKEFIAGDRIPRQGKGGGQGGSEASNSGEGADDFVFQISQDEFLEFLLNVFRPSPLLVGSFRFVPCQFSLFSSFLFGRRLLRLQRELGKENIAVRSRHVAPVPSP